MEMMNTMIRTYSELIKIPTFEERFEYLKLSGAIGEATFGFDRYLNQVFYRSQEWKHIRDCVIFRDNGCDLGIDDRLIRGKILVHHMNPISIQDVENRDRKIFDPEFLICVSHITHNAIHYGDSNLLIKDHVERTPNDTCPWKY